MKADVDMVMEENQTLENENKELKTALEEEKNKVQTLEDKVKELQMALEREKERCSKKNDELVASYTKYHELLRKKIGLDTSLNERKEENEKLQTALTRERSYSKSSAAPRAQLLQELSYSKCSAVPRVELLQELDCSKSLTAPKAQLFQKLDCSCPKLV
ncbi:hypothetical protein Dimus_024548 [Dionaea muscipula]